MSDTDVTIEIDGMEYPLDLASLTGNEVGVLKDIAHLRGVGDVSPALLATDLQTYAALAGIARARAGLPSDYAALLAMPMGGIKVIYGERPTSGPEAETTSGPAGDQSSEESTD